MGSREGVGLASLFVVLMSTCSASAAQAPAVDARTEVAAVLYAASATQAAALSAADGQLRKQRVEIERLRARVRAGAADLQAALTAAEERFVEALASRDRAYAQELAIFRSAVQDIAGTPEGAVALARYNAGDEAGALNILDDLRAARARARAAAAAIESAADGRRIGMLALDALAKGKQTVAAVIVRFEDITRLDAGVTRDWLHLADLYRQAGRLADALRSVKVATEDTEQTVAMAALVVRGDVQKALGDASAALDSYRGAIVSRSGCKPRVPRPSLGPSRFSMDWSVSVKHKRRREI